MPTCRRKRVVLTQPSDELLGAVKTNPKRDVFFLKQTGEIFENYEAYAARMSFYRLKQFQCEVTGKSGLDYFQALESERQEARTLHSRFSAPLKPAILKAVQWQVVGRLDHLVEAVYERFKDRYFKGEKVIVDLTGKKFYGVVDTVYTPRYYDDVDARDSRKESLVSSSSPKPALEEPHLIAGDLKIPAKDFNASDPPERYFYWVQILEPEKDKSHDKVKSAQEKQKMEEAVGSLMEVTCHLMSRDRLTFSKSILRRFIRDCVDRDAAVASPWTVKAAIAKRYGVNSDMSEETRLGVETIKKGEIDKRKKVWEDKDGPPSKRKKMTPAQEERAEKKERDALEKSEKQRLVKEEADRIAAEKKKKKPVRYPTEDLDVRLTEKDKKGGMKMQKPIPNRTILPFNETSGVFEAFLMSWNFLIVYGQPLHLSPFTLDEFEQAIRHTMADPPCTLLAEVHATLIYNLRTVPFHRHSAVLSLLHRRDETQDENDESYDYTIDNLTNALTDIGNNWERVPLRVNEGRDGWEDALVGCLKDHANLQNFPRLQDVLMRLLFAPEAEPEEQSGSPAASGSRTPPTSGHTVPSTPAERYPFLPPADRIAIISFMTNLAISSKGIHTHMESCEEQLTALRKEKIEVNRSKKSLTEEMGTLLPEVKGEALADEDLLMGDPSDSELGGSDVASVSDSPSTSKKKTARQKDLRQKMQSQAKQREAARAKQASTKQAVAEHRRLDEELNKVERRLEGIERDFRKLLGGVRVKPLGRDRFFNRVWWFDGLGSGALLGSSGACQYGSGRVFIQGPSETDMDLLNMRADENIEDRRKEEEGEDGILTSTEWATYDLDELEEYIAWMNPKGHREVALKAALTKWWPHISGGMRKRAADIQVSAKLPEARRSARTKSSTTCDVSREPYMTWTNRRAATA